jgi:alginate O-acetyltransferase complex protein AlgJ
MTRTTAIRIAFAALAVAFFAAPIGARMLGITAEAFENRKFAEAPKLSQRWNAFQQTGAFLTDRMPLRAQAVRANTRIWQDVFGATPRYGSQSSLAGDQALPFAPAGDGQPADQQPGQPGQPVELTAEQKAAQVLPGKDGWLYVAEEQRRSCAPYLPFGDAFDRWDALLDQIRAKGKRAILVIPPDKSSIYPEHLDDVPDGDCAARGKAELAALLERAGGRAGILELRRELLRRKRTAGDDLYTRKDSHWTTLGSLALVDAVLDRLGDGVVRRRDEVVNPGRAEYTGDLTLLLGASEKDTYAQRAIRRRDGAPRILGRTLVVGDSYFNAPNEQLAPYLEDFLFLSWVDNPIPQIAAEIEAADTVILETVEREFTWRAADFALVPPLRKALRTARPGG